MSTFTQNDFSGGLTDSPFTSDASCGEVTDNILINKDKTPRTSPGADLYSLDASRVPTNKRISKFHRLGDSIIAFSDGRAFKVTTSGISEILGPTGNKAFNLGTETSIASSSVFNNHLIATDSNRSYPIKIWVDDNGDTRLVTAGLPQPSTDPIITGSGTKNYVYAFLYFYEYRVGTTLFQDYGPTRLIRKVSAHDTSNSISAIPVLSNGSDYNYDVTNVKVKVFRTTHNGSTFYYIGQVSNGTTTLVDTITDANLVLGESLYTNGGIQPNDPPPPSRAIFEANGTYYYIDVIQSTEEKPFRLLQSITNDPDSVPASFFSDFKSTAKGGGAVGRSAVAFTENETVRLDGIIDETGAGLVTKETISNTVGCVAHNSIVQTSDGLYFAGKDAFYLTNGYGKPTKLAKKANNSSKIDNIYKALVSTDVRASRIQGVYQELTNRVFWAVSNTGTDNDTLFVYDETHDLFTTISFTNSGIQPTALLVDGEDLIIGDARGYLFRLSDQYYTYPVVDTSKAVTSWIYETIIYRWKSVQLGMGDSSVNKWFNKINVQGNPETNIAMGVRVYTNGEPEYKELYPIRLLPSFVWDDPLFTWGDEGFIWNRTATLNQTRRFASGRLRARHRAIEFTNAYTTLQGSTNELSSYVTINSVLKIATLVDPSNYSFGSNNEGYDFIVDGKSYKVTSGTEDTLTLADPSNTLTSGNYEWFLKGYGKGQRAHLLNFSIDYETISDAGTYWRGSAET